MPGVEWKVEPYNIIRYEENYDFVADGSSCHDNQFRKEQQHRRGECREGRSRASEERPFGHRLWCGGEHEEPHHRIHSPRQIHHREEGRRHQLHGNDGEGGERQERCVSGEVLPRQFLGEYEEGDGYEEITSPPSAFDSEKSS